jgi:hypothetical protein
MDLIGGFLKKIQGCLICLVLLITACNKGSKIQQNNEMGNKTNTQISTEMHNKMFVSGLETVDLWKTPWHLNYPDGFILSIPFGEEVLLLGREVRNGSWSRINYNGIIGYVATSFLASSKEGCALIDQTNIEKYLGIYRYDCSLKYIGNIEDFSDISVGGLEGNFSPEEEWENWEIILNNNSYIEVKLFDINRLLVLGYMPNLDLFNEYVFKIPRNYFEIIDTAFADGKPNYHEYYFKENCIVHRTGSYGFTDLNRSVYSSVSEFVYRK